MTRFIDEQRVTHGVEPSFARHWIVAFAVAPLGSSRI